jgi:hypothetical protein
MPHMQVMDQFFSRFDALAAKMQAAAPVAWNKLIVLEQYKSWGELIMSVIVFVTTISLFLLGKNLFLRADLRQTELFNAITEYNKTITSHYGKKAVPAKEAGANTIFGGLCWAAAGLLFLYNIVFMFASKWMWIGLMSPESRLINDLWSTLVR